LSHWKAKLALAAALFATGPVAAQSGLDAADAALVDGFQAVCLDGLPDFVGAAESLKAAGYEVYEYGQGELELFREDENAVPLWGVISAAGCSLTTDLANMKAASSALRAILAARYSAEPQTWTYNGEFAGWTVPSGGKVLYVIIRDPAEPEVPRVGFSAELRDR
jgi:hypothetical protein